MINPLDTQVGGGHYKVKGIQPVEYIYANGLSYFEGNVVKYITRWRDKGGIKDLEKAIHYIQLLIQLEKNKDAREPKKPDSESRARLWEYSREAFGHAPTKDEVPEDYYYSTKTIGG